MEWGLSQQIKNAMAATNESLCSLNLQRLQLSIRTYSFTFVVSWHSPVAQPAQAPSPAALGLQMSACTRSTCIRGLSVVQYLNLVPQLWRTGARCRLCSPHTSAKWTDHRRPGNSCLISRVDHCVAWIKVRAGIGVNSHAALSVALFALH